MNENEINLEKFINDCGDKAFRTLRKKFYYLSIGELCEVLQRSYEALINNLKDNKYDKSSGASLSTYFIAICKNQAKKILEQKYQFVHFRGEENIRIDRRPEGDDREAGQVPIEELEEVRQQENYDQEKIRELLEFGSGDNSDEVNDIDILKEILAHLPSPCNDIIGLFYYDDLSLQEIADELGYSGARTVETTKQRCLKRLKKKFLDERNRFYESI